MLGKRRLCPRQRSPGQSNFGTAAKEHLIQITAISARNLAKIGQNISFMAIDRELSFNEHRKDPAPPVALEKLFFRKQSGAAIRGNHHGNFLGSTRLQIEARCPKLIRNHCEPPLF